MNLPDKSPLAESTAQAILEALFPGYRLLSSRLAPGSYSNYTHILTARPPNGEETRLVVRRYQVFGDYSRSEKARREFTALECACRHGIPAPQPLYLDETGHLLGIPGIVTRYVVGEQIQAPADPLSWARALAGTLAQIHAVPCDPATRLALLDANAAATWFLRSEGVPEPMQAHPKGERIWQAMRRTFPQIQPVQPALIHLDYWSGNVLWEGERISAVVDWEEAARGDPAIDVAYSRMDMVLLGLPQAADEFLRAYEEASGHPLANLAFWELAAAARPLYTPVDWIDTSPAAERFAAFLTGAIERL